MGICGKCVPYEKNTEGSMILFDRRVKVPSRICFQVSDFRITPETRKLKVRLKRDALWLPSSQLEVQVGVDFGDSLIPKATGRGTGGVRLDHKGQEVPEYSLTLRFYSFPQNRKSVPGFVCLKSLKGEADVHMIVEASE